MDAATDRLKTQIIHLLGIYPVLSPTMLQGGLGPQAKPSVWKPILEQLIDEGEIVREHEDLLTPAGRYHTYHKLRLKGDRRQQQQH